MPLDPSQIFSFLNNPIFQDVIFVLRIIFIVAAAAMLGFLIWALFFGTLYLKRLFLWDFQEFTASHPYGAKKLYGPWQKTKIRLETGLETEYKLAVIEADSLFDDVLRGAGFTGETFAERLNNLTESTLPNIHDVLSAHETRNNIVHNPDSHLTLNEARRAVEIYEKALTDLQVL